MASGKRQPEEWVTVFSALNIAEARLIAARLSGAGIRDVVCREAASGALPVSFGLLARIDIVAPQQEKNTAIQVLIDLGILEEIDDDGAS